MLDAAQLGEFAKLAFERLARHVAERDPIRPRAFGARLEGGAVVLAGDVELGDEASGAAGRIPEVVASLLALPDMEAVAVAHEAWASKVPGIPAELFERMMGHLDWNEAGRAEAVICAIHGEGFQTAILHAVRRQGGARRLEMGRLTFEGVTLGGAMARDLPTRH